MPNSILLGRWFGPRLPTAMAILYSATGAGILVLLPASQVLIDRIGWRDAYQMLRHRGAVPAGAAAVAAVAAVRHRLAACRARSPTPISSTNGWTLGARCATTPSGRCSATFFFTAVGDVRDHGADRRLSDRCRLPAVAGRDRLGLFRRACCCSACSAISTLDGIIGRRPSVLFSYGVSIVGIILLWLLQYYPNYWLLTGFVVCFGSMIGSRGPLITATALNIFRGERVGTIYGTISIGSGLGSGLGSWAGGLIHDWTHSYNTLFVFALVNVVLGLIPFLVVPALRR